MWGADDYLHPTTHNTICGRYSALDASCLNSLEEVLLCKGKENDQGDQCHPLCCFEILDQRLELGVKRSFLSDYLLNQISLIPAFAAEEFEEELAPEPPAQAAKLNAEFKAMAVRKVCD